MEAAKKNLFKTGIWLKVQKLGPEAALLAIPLVLIAFDQLTKHLTLKAAALQTPQTAFWGLSFGISENHSWMFGLGKWLTPMFSMALASTLIPALIFVYIILVYYMPKSLRALNWISVLLFGGALSNLIDKAFLGYVLDIFVWKVGPISLYINLADIFQTAGWLLLIYGIIRLRKSIWMESEKRKRLLIKKTPQLEFISYVMFVTIITSLFFIIMNQQFSGYIQTLEPHEQPAAAAGYMTYILIILIPLALPLVFVSLYVSNKVYGPVYAFERYIKNLLADKNPPSLQLRKGDQLKELEALALSIKHKIEQLKGGASDKKPPQEGASD